MGVPVHGGDLANAIKAARHAGFDPGRIEDWLDLSTGINANPYPVFDIPAKYWYQLPGEKAMIALREAAASYYCAPGYENVVAAPGSAALIKLLPQIIGKKTVQIISPTYGDHADAWQQAGIKPAAVTSLDNAQVKGVTVLVNPNNPDGSLTPFHAISKFCQTMQDPDDLLIIDEAFGDSVPEHSATSLVTDHNVIVLKSVGKFFGLAGLRLGFAICSNKTAGILQQALGSWPVSGPALALGTKALLDKDWQVCMRGELDKRAKAFNHILTDAGFGIYGSTALFSLIESPKAETLFNRLLHQQIYVRRFSYNPAWLRIGVPGNKADLVRFEQALRK